jgi:hypothetical protein
MGAVLRDMGIPTVTNRLNPDAVVIGRKGDAASFVDAFSLKRVPAGAPRTHLTKLVSEIAFASTFFRRCWLLLDAPPKDVAEIGESIFRPRS